MHTTESNRAWRPRRESRNVSRPDGLRPVLVTCWPALVMLAACAADGTASKDGDFSTWSHVAYLEKVASAGVTEIALSPAVVNLAKPDLADLRLVSEAGVEMAYALRVSSRQTHRVPLDVKLYNRTYLLNQQTSVTVDFGRKILKNRVAVKTGGINFLRKVLIEGSDDGQGWQKVRENAFLFRLRSDRSSYEKDLVTLPENDQRHLRVTVFNAPDDPERIAVIDVRAWRTVGKAARIQQVAIVSQGVVEDEKLRATKITLDLGYKNLPLAELILRFTDTNFFRRVHLAGRNCIERVVRVPTEDGASREKTVAEPWQPFSEGAVYRFSAAGSVEESLTLDLKGRKYRYLQLRIDNDDDPPLHFDGARVARLGQFVDFHAKFSGRYVLYFGNPQAAQPRYDIVHYIDRLRTEGVDSATLGRALANPAFGQAEQTVPWSERHKALLWAALLAVMIVLGLLVYRQSRSAQLTQREEDGGNG